MPRIPLYSTHTYLLLHTSCNPPQPPRATPTAPHGPTLPYSPLSSHIPTTSPPLPLHPQTTSAPGGTGSSAGGSGGPGPDAGSSAAAVGAPSPSAVPNPRIPRPSGAEGSGGDGGGIRAALGSSPRHGAVLPHTSGAAVLSTAFVVPRLRLGAARTALANSGCSGGAGLRERRRLTGQPGGPSRLLTAAPARCASANGSRRRCR